MAHPASAAVRLAFATLVLLAAVPAQTAAPGPASATFRFDFTDFAPGPAADALAAKGFKFQEDMKDRGKIDLAVATGRLVVTTKARTRGQALNDAINVPRYSRIRVRWGVDRYPEGASYERGVRNEPLMIHVFFGTEKISSGSLFAPDSPYFIGLFLCQDGKLRQPYVGNYYPKGGRYVCLDSPAPGTEIESEFDLRAAFAAYFAGATVPAITGLAISVDTSDSGGGGRAQSFVRSIALVE